MSRNSHLPALDRFLAVVRVGSLNRAAEMLHISQPALTKSIQTLEERLGVELFVREARGVSLTTYGKALLIHARLIDSEMRKIRKEIEALKDLTSGSVNVGAPPGAGFHSNILPAVTLRIAGGERRISINYSMGTREQLLPALREGRLDLMIAVIVEDDTTADLMQEPLFDDRNCVVVRRGHPLLANQPVRIEDLVAYPWFVMSDSVALESALRAKAGVMGLTPARSIVRSDSTQLLKTAVLAGNGVGLTRYDVSRADIHVGGLCELQLGLDTDALGRYTLGLVYRRDAELSAASEQLIEEIREQCRTYA